MERPHEPVVARARGSLIAALRNNLAAQGFALATRVALVPYTLSRLSRDEYGLWAWMLTLSAFLVLAEFGFTQGIIHPLARALRDKDVARIRRMIAAAMAVPATIIGAVVVIVLLAPVAPLAKTSAAGTSAVSVLVPLILAQGVSLCGLPLLSLLAGLQRLDLAQALRLPQTILNAALTVVLLERGGGACSLAWLQLGMAAFQTGARWVACRRLLPEFGLGIARPERRDFGELRVHGAPMVLLNLLWAVIFGYERAFLGWITDLASFTQYAVASRLVLTVLELQQIPFAAILQASAALDAAGEHEALRRLYARSLRLTAAVAFALVGALWVSGPAIVRAWVGPQFDLAGQIVGRLAIAMLVPGLMGPGIGILGGRNRLRRVSPLLIQWMVLCAILDSVWLFAFGIREAGVGLALINASGTVAFLRRFSAEEDPPATAALLLRLAAGATFSALVAWGLGSMIGGLVPDGRIGAMVDAFATATVFGFLYLGIAHVGGMLGAEDRRLLFDVVGRRLGSVALGPPPPPHNSSVR